MNWIAQHKRTVLIIIVVASVLLRLAVALIMGNTIKELPGLTDQFTYHTLALRVLGGYGFSFGENWWPATHANEPTAHWSYLYTFYLIGVYGLFGPNPLVARLLQAVAVGILHPWLVYKIGSRLFNPLTGLIGAAWIALYTYMIYYSPALLTEPFYIAAVLGVLYLAIQIVSAQTASEDDPGKPSSASLTGKALLLGLCIGAATLLRQLFMLFLPFLFLWMAWALRKKLRQAIGQMAIATAVLGLMIAPFTIFNYVRFHSFVLLNTNAGYAFYWANHPIYGTHFESIVTPETGNYLEMLPGELNKLKLNEAELEKELMKRGIQFVLDDPVRYVLLSFSRIPSYFTFWPTPNSSTFSNFSRVASFGIAMPFIVYGIILALLRRDKKDFFATPLFLILLFFVIYSLIHILTWTLVRYRMPVDTVLITFAAYALLDLYDRLSRRFKKLPGPKGLTP